MRVLVTLDGAPMFHGVTSDDRILVAQWLGGWTGVDVVSLHVIHEWVDRGDDVVVASL